MPSKAAAKQIEEFVSDAFIVLIAQKQEFRHLQQFVVALQSVQDDMPDDWVPAAAVFNTIVQCTKISKAVGVVLSGSLRLQTDFQHSKICTC